ncbi:hypothetical protein B0T17DRAFT_509968 [Bombardia bombarda]|uniref:Uncharacterized protein n=1 Tax=Bombardia bombarda TaxID=252184 RepID=A0AA40BYJ8_9PEZI|nr:hypothetical protein B0T17DRAFT_509968 [Bombardia bombarda]
MSSHAHAPRWPGSRDVKTRSITRKAAAGYAFGLQILAPTCCVIPSWTSLHRMKAAGLDTSIGIPFSFTTRGHYRVRIMGGGWHTNPPSKSGGHWIDRYNWATTYTPGKWSCTIAELWAAAASSTQPFLF